MARLHSVVLGESLQSKVHFLFFIFHIHLNTINSFLFCNPKNTRMKSIKQTSSLKNRTRLKTQSKGRNIPSLHLKR